MMPVRGKAMQLKSFFVKANQILFSGNIFKLFFSYRGTIARTPYVIAVLLLLLMLKFCVFGVISYVLVFFLFIHSLVALIQKRTRSFGSSGTWYILVNLLFIYSVILTYDIDVAFFPAIKWVNYLAIGMVSITHLIMALSPSKQNIKEPKSSFLTRFPIIFTILVFAGVFAVFGLKDKYLPDTNRPTFRLGLAIGEIYRHTYSYPEFCKEQGYEMVNYPNKVREKFKEEIEMAENDQMALLARASDEKYTDIDDFYKRADWGTKEDRFQSPASFIGALRKQLIIIDVAKEQNIDTDKVKLTSQDNERVSLKDACKTMDEDADYFTSSDCPFKYILNYAEKYSNCGTYFNTKNHN